MGWNQAEGYIDGWPEGMVSALYHTIIEAYPKKDYKWDFMRHPETGHKLYLDGTEAVEPYPDDAEFLKEIVRYTKYKIIVNTYYSHAEAQEYIANGIPARSSTSFEFTEPYEESQVVAAGSTLVEAIYNHPLLVEQVPSDWVPDL